MPGELLMGKFEWNPVSLSGGVGQSRLSTDPKIPAFPTVTVIEVIQLTSTAHSLPSGGNTGWEKDKAQTQGREARAYIGTPGGGQWALPLLPLAQSCPQAAVEPVRWASF